MSETTPPTSLVSGKLAALAAAAVPVLMALAAVVPHPVGPVLGILAFVAAVLAGVALPLPTWMAGKPIIPLALVPAFSTLAVLAEQFSVSAEGLVKHGAHLVALILSFLAGLAAPQPVQPVAPAPAPVPPAQ